MHSQRVGMTSLQIVQTAPIIVFTTPLVVVPIHGFKTFSMCTLHNKIIRVSSIAIPNMEMIFREPIGG